MSNQSNKQQEELAKLVEEAHLNIIKAIASTYTAEQLEVALTLRKEMEGAMAKSLSTVNLSSLKSATQSKIDPFDTPPWESDVDNNGGD